MAIRTKKKWKIICKIVPIISKPQNPLFIFLIISKLIWIKKQLNYNVFEWNFQIEKLSDEFPIGFEFIEFRFEIEIGWEKL